MRRAIISTLVLVVTFIAGLKVGGFLQHQKTGYFYEIRSVKTHPSPMGTVQLKYATETIGMPFLDPGTSFIVLDDPSGLELTVYKARRVFQESYPYPKDVLVNENRIQWDDGCYTYDLRLAASQRSQATDEEASVHGHRSKGRPPSQVRMHVERTDEREPE